MILRRATVLQIYPHDGAKPHRQLHPADLQYGTFSFCGCDVVLSQMQPRGLWRFTGMYENQDRMLDERFGEMPLKIAVARLRLAS